MYRKLEKTVPWNVVATSKEKALAATGFSPRTHFALDAGLPPHPDHYVPGARLYQVHPKSDRRSGIA